LPTAGDRRQTAASEAIFTSRRLVRDGVRANVDEPCDVIKSNLAAAEFLFIAAGLNCWRFT
jgi:hypothetical protein